MRAPSVSICLPTLNARCFLAQRLASIAGQTLTDWETVVVDGCSEDGTWEDLRRWAREKQRVRLMRAPREGVYAAINGCLREAMGDYIYIATADDTMSPDCLTTMVDALQRHEDCDLVSSELWCIDETGGDIASPTEGQWLETCFGGILQREHIRPPPCAGLLHATGRSVNVSLTQLLVRRRLFDRIGLFRTDFGAVADFEWNMRAGLLANTVYVPRKLGSWRRHGAQATVRKVSASYWRVQGEMIEQAVRAAAAIDPEVLPRGLTIRRLRTLTDDMEFALRLVETRSRIGRAGLMLRTLARRPSSVARSLVARATGRDRQYADAVAFARRLCEDAGPVPWRDA